MRITGSIIDTKYNLIGFVTKGKAKEYGSFGEEEVEVNMTVQDFIKRKPKNSQLTINHNKIMERSNFKINSLPMLVYDVKGPAYTPIDNRIDIVKKFVSDNKIVGFTVQFSNGKFDNIRYENLIILSKWFKPHNFQVRTSSTTGKSFICGANNCKLDDIETEILGAEPTKKKLDSAAQKTGKTIKGYFENGIDILDVLEWAEAYNGSIVNLPNTKYEGNIVEEVKLEEFVNLGIGEIALAKPIFAANKLNVSLKFKQVGIVNINNNGRNQQIVTFVYRDKNVFYNGQNSLSRIAVAFPSEKEQEFVEIFSKSLSIQKIEDEKFISPMRQVMGNNNLVFYAVDTSKLDLLTSNKLNKYVLSNKELRQLAYKLYEYKLIEKAFGPKSNYIVNLKQMLGEELVAKIDNKQIAPQFSDYKQEFIEVLKQNDLDVYSGAYTKRAEVKMKTTKTTDTEKIAIEYTVDGYDYSKITGNKIIEAVVNGDENLLPKSVFNYISEVINVDETMSTQDYMEAYKAAKEAFNKASKGSNEIIKKLWKHNVSMYLKGNKAKVHTHDSKLWNHVDNARLKTATMYRCAEEGCTDLVLKISGVEL